MHTQEKGTHINNLFGPDVQYQVPRYQRRYVWDDTNWSTLWEDILSQEKLKNEDRGHFTGPIVTRSIGESQLDKYEVIDGQQRLVTFQIILCVIRDLCVSKKHKELAAEATRHIVNTDDVVRRNDLKDFPYKFLPTDYDKSAFRVIAAGEYGKIRDRTFAEEVSDSIFDAYDYFTQKITQHIGEGCDYDKVSDLISSIKYDFTLVPITLETSDQPEKIFESINATGRMLSEFDYLRNNLFLRARKLEAEQDLDKSYSNIFYDKYWCFENTSLYWDADRLEWFLREFLMAQLGLSCFQQDNGQTKKAFDVYQMYSKKLMDKQGKVLIDRMEKLKYEFEQLRDYAISYEEMTNPDLDIGCRMRFYDDLKITSLRPLLLYLKNRMSKSDNELEQVCNILESYIVRRMVCYGHNSNDKDKHAYQGIDRFFSDLIKSEQEFSVSNLIKSLRGWPTDDAVLQGLRRTSNETFYGKYSARNTAWDLLRYIFYRIERYITEVDMLRFESFLEFGRPTRITPLPPAASDRWRSNRDDFLSIGNLTFCQTSKLSSNKVNNLPFDKTKEILSEPPNSSLELNRKICRHEHWDVEQIRGQKERLYTYFCEIWPDSDSLLKSVLAQTVKFNPEKIYEGVVKSWKKDDLFGYVELPKQGQSIEVKSEDLDPSILSRRLYPFLKVKFNLEMVEKDGHSHFQACNVALVTTGKLYQGKVEMFEPESMFGFLISSDYPDDIYLHETQIQPEYLNLLEKGHLVEFNIAETVEGKAPAAINVRLVNS